MRAVQRFQGQEVRLRPDSDLDSQLAWSLPARMSVRALKAMAAVYNLPKACAQQPDQAPLELAALNAVEECGGCNAQFACVFPRLLRRIEAGQAWPLVYTQAWSNVATSVLRQLSADSGWEF
jgi:hypothetical protein